MPDWLSPEIQRDLLGGAVLTVAITVLTSIGAVVLGVVAGLGRSSPQRRIRWPAATFVEVFRNVPALIQIIFFAFAIPSVVPQPHRRSIFFDNTVIDVLSDITGLTLPWYAIAASLALTLNTGGHIAELFRSGVNTIPSERIETARNLGASPTRAAWTVTIPDALRSIWPGLTTRLVHNMKNTALVSFVAVPDLFQVIQGSITKTFRAQEFLILAAILYLALSSVMTVLLEMLGSRLRRGRPMRRELGV